MFLISARGLLQKDLSQQKWCRLQMGMAEIPMVNMQLVSSSLMKLAMLCDATC